MKTGIYLAALICASVFYSCDKDDDSPAAPPTPSQTRYQILTSHYWRASGSSGIVVTDTDFNSVLDTLHYSISPDSCTTDDRFYFHTNGFFLSDPGTVTCSDSPDSSAWSLVNNDTQILIDTTTYSIISFSSSLVKVTSTMILNPPYFEITDTSTFVYP